MVKKETKTSVSEEKDKSSITNEHGKRVGEDLNVDPKKRQRTRGLYRQPTVNELNRLQETENLFNSNLFRLQIEEILQEVKVKEKTEKKFQQWFSEFKTHLESISEDDTEYDLTEKTLAKKLKVKIPIPSALNKTKCMFKFHKFKDLQIIGSYSIECAINSKLCIDIQITVPSDTYTKNDSINYRYHKKRAAYLAYIASHLKKLECIEELNYTCLNGCETKPVIDIKPAGKLANHFSVRILLACEEEAYKLHRFSPSRNNLRETWLLEENTENTIETGPPTPYYNSSILSDITSCTNEELLKEVLLKSENLKQAVVLLKIWLRQRSLQVSGHIVSLLVVYLVQNKRINNIMSSYQIVRNVWIALKTADWDTKGISLHKPTDTPSPPIEEFLQHFPIVFLDRTGYYNLTYQMNRGTYDALKRESALAVEMLDNGNINSFIPLFMVSIRPLVHFDHILRFKNLPALKEAIVSRAPKETRVNYGVDQLALVVDSLHSLLAKGLANRADLILPLVEANLTWSVKKSQEKAKAEHEDKVSFGLILNPETATNVIEKGPPANLPEAEEFRAFWGSKSELRRFQDGSITETVVWEADTLSEQRALSVQIVNYLLQERYEIPSSNLFHVTNQLDSLLTRKQRSTSMAQCEELSVEALRAFDELRRDLRGLTQLPLDVSAVYGVSPVFSYCDPLPSPPCPAPPAPWRRHHAALVKDKDKEGGSGSVPPYTKVCAAVLGLGHSGKWPGDLEAFRCLKAAFHLQIADRLHAQYSMPTQAYKSHIDVLKSGLVFRLSIAHPKEITLLRRQLDNGVVRHRDGEESERLQRETVLLPRLRGALHGLHQRHLSFGPTACLLKRWLCCHLLSAPLFPSTLAELLTAAVYLHPEPLTAPLQPMIGFLRVLRLIADTDWSNEMVLLDFNGDMTREEKSSIERTFASRDPLTSPAVYLVTSFDGYSPGVWAGLGPSRPVLARAQVLARQAGQYVERALEECNDNILPIFVPSLAGYDVLIHLHPHLVPYVSERVDKRCDVTTDQPIAEEVIPVVEFNVVERYLDELRSAYGDFAMFFHDSYGGEVIAVLWKPDIGEDREFQLTNANALKPVPSNGVVSYRVNVAAIVEDFSILGRGIVRDVVTV